MGFQIRVKSRQELLIEHLEQQIAEQKRIIAEQDAAMMELALLIAGEEGGQDG